MDTNVIAFLVAFSVLLFFIFWLKKKEKEKIIFNPEWDGISWTNHSIQNILNEDLCKNCLNHKHCGIRKDAENIKDKYDAKFILTRCKTFQANNSLKMRKKPKQQKHFGVIVWVNPFTENMREKQCMCINDCRNLNINDRGKNCPMANELYTLCVQCNLATIVFSCPVWDEIQKVI